MKEPVNGNFIAVRIFFYSSLYIRFSVEASPDYIGTTVEKPCKSTLLPCKAEEYIKIKLFSCVSLHCINIVQFKRIVIAIFSHLVFVFYFHANFETFEKNFVFCEETSAVQVSSYLERGNSLWLNFLKL